MLLSFHRNIETDYKKRDLSQQLASASEACNYERLEKKKNREKRRRSEVNERFNEVWCRHGIIGMVFKFNDGFDQLVDVMDKAQGEILGGISLESDCNKGVMTKSDLLERAVELVKALSEENRMLKRVSAIYCVLCLLFFMF